MICFSEDDALFLIVREKMIMEGVMRGLGRGGCTIRYVLGEDLYD